METFGRENGEIRDLRRARADFPSRVSDPAPTRTPDLERYKFYPDGAIFYITFSVVDWMPVFVSETACKIVTDSLRYCHVKKGLRINAYVVMPTHFHGIFFHESFDATALAAVVADFRKFTGRVLCDFCDKRMPRCFGETFRSAAGDDRARKFWQPTRHPVQIESEPFWQTKIDYLHENPCRKGLVIRAGDWRFSSARYWLSDGQIGSEVPLNPIEW